MPLDSVGGARGHLRILNTNLSLPMKDPEKYGNEKGLTLSRGGLYARRELSPEEWLEDEMHEWAVLGKRGAGRFAYVSRAVADIAHEQRWPHRVPARIIREALEGGATVGWAREFGVMLIGYAERKARAMGLADDQPNRAA